MTKSITLDMIAAARTSLLTLGERLSRLPDSIPEKTSFLDRCRTIRHELSSLQSDFATLLLRLEPRESSPPIPSVPQAVPLTETNPLPAPKI